ncbi:hypothetical protein FRX31_012803 [Thalictrum thalictroides]|uniref:Uncharacterized protein n=1 Tax=Thalictrum thalictroides TaxID=46969 RepID=A0A7J6WNE1_THATH|nr:hypothetical protein FRX31_012803 [Thalictrum thalictroides]
MDLHNVVTLSLKGFYIEFLTRDQDLSTSLVTSSYSLKTLKLHMHTTKNQLQVVTFLLRRYRNVQSLSIYFSQDDYTSLNMLNMEEYWQSEVLSMGDTLSHLKTVEIDLFQGRDTEEQMRLSAKLLTLTRISPNAAIYLA